ncbi:MAG: MFS transporter [Acidobacteriota bacterium]
MASATYRDLLKSNKDFRQLWIGQVISELGTWFSFIAELGLVRLLSGSAMSTTMLLVARLLPFLLVAPIAGVFVDSRSRKRILIAADIARALLALGYLTVGVRGPLWVVYLCAALTSSCTTFFEAAKNSSMPNLVEPKDLLTANVLMFSTRFLQLTLGAALGGVTAARFGYAAAFVVNALSFVASAAFIWPIAAGALQRSGRSGQGKLARSLWSEVHAGLKYIRHTPFVRGIILVNVAWATGGGMTNLLFDQIGGHTFTHGKGDRGDWGVATLYTAAGLGLFVGMMMARRAGAWAVDERRAGRFIGWALVAHGICFAIAGIMPSLVLMSLWLMASRMILGAEFGVQETLMMRVLPDEYRGRVFTTDRALELTMMTISMIIGGWMVTVVGARTMMIVSGVLSASPGVAWLLALWLRRFKVPEGALAIEQASSSVGAA